MKSIRKTFKKSRKNVPDNFKTIDTSNVTVTNVKLGARTRTKEQKEPKTKKIPLEQLKDGIERLAEPRVNHPPPIRENWNIKKSVLKYKPTERIQSLAKPRFIVAKVESEAITPQSSFQSTVSPRALNYKPTARIRELARPKNYAFMEEPYEEREAYLEHETYERIQSMTKRQDIVANVNVEAITPQTTFQTTVSPRALSYRPTPRILELARPKKYQQFIPEPSEEKEEYNDFESIADMADFVNKYIL